MKKLLIFTLGLLTLGLSTANAEGVYELRTYLTNEGKLDALHARFSDHTIGLFEKHGMENIGYWVPIDTPNTLIYIIKHQNIEAAKKSWADFINDPEWKIVAEESQKDGQILAKAPESVFMTETAYSMLEK